MKKMLTHLQLALIRLDGYAHVLPAVLLHLVDLLLGLGKSEQRAECSARWAAYKKIWTMFILHRLEPPLVLLSS